MEARDVKVPGELSMVARLGTELRTAQNDKSTPQVIFVILSASEAPSCVYPLADCLPRRMLQSIRWNGPYRGGGSVQRVETSELVRLGADEAAFLRTGRVARF